MTVLKEWAKSRKIKLYEIAKLTGYSYSAVRMVSQGKKCGKGLANALSRLTKIPVEEFIKK